ncbi:MAG TPA: hypothetical protein VGP72_10530 [Planctomycetota bacterium]|jgi:hypothetical protein
MDLTWTRGDTLAISITVTDGAEPINLASAHAIMTAKANIADADENALFQIDDTGGDITFPTPEAGEMVVTVPPEATKDLADDKLAGVYDVQVTLQDGSVYTVLSGALTLSADVTRG